MKKWKIDIVYCGVASERGIEEIEVVRETPKQIVYLSSKGKEERIYKESSTVFICDSYNEAVAKGQKYFKRNITKAFDRLQYERGKLKEFNKKFCNS